MWTRHNLCGVLPIEKVIKLKYESRIYSNSYSFAHNSLKLLRRLFGFYTSYKATYSKSSQTFFMASMYDNMTYVQVSGFTGLNNIY
jgi:hypothetical protein